MKVTALIEGTAGERVARDFGTKQSNGQWVLYFDNQGQLHRFVDYVNANGSITIIKKE